MQTVLPEGASQIDPSDADTLRFAVRTDGHSGYLFLNNFQDHMETKTKENETVILHMTGRTSPSPESVWLLKKTAFCRSIWI